MHFWWLISCFTAFSKARYHEGDLSIVLLMLHGFESAVLHKKSSGCYVCAKYCIFCTVVPLCLHVSCSLMTAILHIRGITTLVFIFSVQRHVVFHLDENFSFLFIDLLHYAFLCMPTRRLFLCLSYLTMLLIKCFTWGK